MHNLIGKAQERQGEHLEAVKSFDAAIALDGKFAEAHGNRAAILAAAGLHDEALKGFDRALALDPKAVADWINRGALLARPWPHDEAIESYSAPSRSTRKLCPRISTAPMRCAPPAGRRTRSPPTSRRWRSGRSLPEAQVGRAAALKELGRPEEALAAVELALAARSELAPAHRVRGRLLQALGRAEEAEAALAKAAELEAQARAGAG